MPHPRFQYRTQVAFIVPKFAGEKGPDLHRLCSIRRHPGGSIAHVLASIWCGGLATIARIGKMSGIDPLAHLPPTAPGGGDFGAPVTNRTDTIDETNIGGPSRLKLKIQPSPPQYPYADTFFDLEVRVVGCVYQFNAV